MFALSRLTRDPRRLEGEDLVVWFRDTIKTAPADSPLHRIAELADEAAVIRTMPEGWLLCRGANVGNCRNYVVQKSVYGPSQTASTAAGAVRAARRLI